MENKDLNNAILRIVPRIKEQDMINLVDNTLYISDLQKEFYKVMLLKRKEIILDKAYNNLLGEGKNIKDEEIMWNSRGGR